MAVKQEEALDTLTKLRDQMETVQQQLDEQKDMKENIVKVTQELEEQKILQQAQKTEYEEQIQQLKDQLAEAHKTEKKNNQNQRKTVAQRHEAYRLAL